MPFPCRSVCLVPSDNAYAAQLTSRSSDMPWATRLPFDARDMPSSARAHLVRLLNSNTALAMTARSDNASSTSARLRHMPCDWPSHLGDDTARRTRLVGTLLLRSSDNAIQHSTSHATGQGLHTSSRVTTPSRPMPGTAPVHSCDYIWPSRLTQRHTPRRATPRVHLFSGLTSTTCLRGTAHHSPGAYRHARQRDSRS